MMIERRSFLTGLVSALAAPVIVRHASLMQVRGIILPPPIADVPWGYDAGDWDAATLGDKLVYRIFIPEELPHGPFVSDPFEAQKS